MTIKGFFPGQKKVKKTNKLTMTRTKPMGGSPMHSGTKEIAAGGGFGKRMMSKRGVNQKITEHNKRVMRKHKIGI